MYNNILFISFKYKGVKIGNYTNTINITNDHLSFNLYLMSYYYQYSLKDITDLKIKSCKLYKDLTK